LGHRITQRLKDKGSRQKVKELKLHLIMAHGERFRVQGSGFRVQGSAQPSAKKTAGPIEKKTNSSPQSSLRTLRRKM
jgi:hypothetical protein